jgi:hypothetical protein
MQSKRWSSLSSLSLAAILPNLTRSQSGMQMARKHHSFSTLNSLFGWRRSADQVDKSHNGRSFALFDLVEGAAAPKKRRQSVHNSNKSISTSQSF